MKIFFLIMFVMLSQILAFSFGRAFKGWLGFLQDILVWIAAAIFIMPAVLLTHGQSTIGVFAWFVSWAGAYSIGNIEKGPSSQPLTTGRWFARTWLFPIWLIVWVIIIARLSVGLAAT